MDHRIGLSAILEEGGGSDGWQLPLLLLLAATLSLSHVPQACYKATHCVLPFGRLLPQRRESHIWLCTPVKSCEFKAHDLDQGYHLNFISNSLYVFYDLVKVSAAGGEKEWYFFCLRGRKYKNSIRPNRVTESGFWKATGIDRPIYSTGDAGDCIGLKKSLVYYRGSAGKGTKTDWMMHEFRLPASDKNDDNSPRIQEAEIWTICRIFKRNVSYKKYPQGCKVSASKQMSTDSSSKTSSFESDTGNEYKCLGSSSILQGDMKLITSYYEEKNQILASQWNPIVQAPLTTWHPNIPYPSTNEFFKDGNWDELGRIMEFMTDTSKTHFCRYT